uniref:CDGSH iron-sulfur domain-containing protein 2 homologue n=1 Tax=Echinococcus granulosus TaxID=6210 RepID=A0A068WM06_ECHGR|nr:cdgsh iron sulfur domain containing protein [Echinococcus granulosus]
MNVLHGIVRVHIPELLASVPIPETFSGLFSLSRYSVYFTMKNRYFSKHVNTLIKKDQEKVVDFIDIESIGRKAVYCRCWKSKKARHPARSSLRQRKVPKSGRDIMIAPPKVDSPRFFAPDKAHSLNIFIAALNAFIFLRWLHYFTCN